MRHVETFNTTGKAAQEVAGKLKVVPREIIQLFKNLKYSRHGHLILILANLGRTYLFDSDSGLWGPGLTYLIPGWWGLGLLI